MIFQVSKTYNSIFGVNKLIKKDIMNRKGLLLFVICFSTISFGQDYKKISTIDFIRILNNNTEEAIYYYQNNWKELRKLALEKEYIDSYNLFFTEEDDINSFHLILLTTYKNIEQYDLREKNFDELIEMRDGLQLLNDKKPNEFRETLFRKEMVRQFK